MKEYGDAKEMSDTEYLSMKQIADERLAEAHKSLDQEQQLHLLSKQRIKELEEKPTEPESTDQEELAKDGFLKKLLKKYFNP